MMRRRALLLGLGILWVVAAPRTVPAMPAIDVNGAYQLSVVDTVDSCTFAGQAVLTQSGSAFTGTATLSLVVGTGCPSSLSGPVSGTLTGNTISFGIASGGFGTVNFIGTVSNDGSSASGTWSTTGAAAGTWSATRVPLAGAPALSLWSLAVLTLLLGWVGVRLLTSSNRAFTA